MAEVMPAPLDGADYEDVAARALAGWKAGLTGDDSASLVATVEATRRIVDELREKSAALDRLNCGLAELGMPTAALTVSTGRGLSGWPEAVLRLVRADDPEAAYGEIHIPLEVHDA
jgi:hypothetical protein